MKTAVKISLGVAAVGLVASVGITKKIIPYTPTVKQKDVLIIATLGGLTSAGTIALWDKSKVASVLVAAIGIYGTTLMVGLNEMT